MAALQAHQQRVVDEREQLDDRLDKLTLFMATSTFAGLDAAEKERMRRQARAMTEYSNVLGERIAAFGAAA